MNRDEFGEVLGGDVVIPADQLPLALYEARQEIVRLRAERDSKEREVAWFLVALGYGYTFSATGAQLPPWLWDALVTAWMERTHAPESERADYEQGLATELGLDAFDSKEMQ